MNVLRTVCVCVCVMTSLRKEWPRAGRKGVPLPEKFVTVSLPARVHVADLFDKVDVPKHVP